MSLPWGPLADRRARELVAAGRVTAGVDSSCPHPHCPVLLEIVGDGPVLGRRVTPAAVLEGNDADHPCPPERTRAHGPGSCRGHWWSALPVQPSVWGQPCPGCSPAPPRARNSGLISAPASWIVQSLRRRLRAAGGRFRSQLHVLCVRLRVGVYLCVCAHSCNACVRMVCVYVHVMCVYECVCVCVYIRVTWVRMVWVCTHVCSCDVCVRTCPVFPAPEPEPRLPLTGAVPRRNRLEGLSLAAWPARVCRCSAAELLPAGRAVLQLLWGSEPGSSARAQGSRPQRPSEPCLPGALVPQTRLLPAFFLSTLSSLPPSPLPGEQIAIQTCC